LWRASSEGEVAEALERFWSPEAARARDALATRLASAGIAVPDAAPFDESREDEVFPVLIDAGWELHPLAALDPERHKGAILAFGDPIHFDSAKFEEASAYPEPGPYLQELPAIGSVELLRGADASGALTQPLTIWTSGPEPYHDYVLRGVLRAAKI
jgi:hypothetical protein